LLMTWDFPDPGGPVTPMTLEWLELSPPELKPNASSASRAAAPPFSTALISLDNARLFPAFA